MITQIRPLVDSSVLFLDSTSFLPGINMATGTLRTILGCSILFFATISDRNDMTIVARDRMGEVEIRSSVHFKNQGCQNIIKGLGEIVSGLVCILVASNIYIHNDWTLISLFLSYLVPVCIARDIGEHFSLDIPRIGRDGFYPA